MEYVARRLSMEQSSDDEQRDVKVPDPHEGEESDVVDYDYEEQLLLSQLDQLFYPGPTKDAATEVVEKDTESEVVPSSCNDSQENKSTSKEVSVADEETAIQSHPKAAV